MGFKVAFFGTPAFAVPSLDALLRSTHVVVGVITQPDRPRGRGQHVSAGPVKTHALAHALPVIQPDRLSRDAFEGPFAALGAEIGVVAAYGKLLPDWLLAAPPRGLVNVHASLLPRYRGASPIHRAVMAGDAQTGVTIMRVVKALDAGPMLAHVQAPIGPDATTADLEQVLADAGARLLVETLDRMAVAPVAETPQDDALATYAPRLTKTDGLVDWSRSAAAVHNQIRGLSPWPRAYTFLDGERYILHQSRTTSRVESLAAAGTIVTASPTEGLLIACGGGQCIELVVLQLEGRRAMSARDLLASHPLPSGRRFSPP